MILRRSAFARVCWIRCSASSAAATTSRMPWSFLFDIVHHRGQITTYLRPMGSAVPQIYGPSADEP